MDGCKIIADVASIRLFFTYLSFAQVDLVPRRSSCADRILQPVVISPSRMKA